MPRQTKSAIEKKPRSKPEEFPETVPVNATSRFKNNKSMKIAVIVFAVLILGALLYQYKSFFVVATVNGRPISRIALIKELEKQDGKQVLDTLITKSLVEQAAAEKNIQVAQSDIDAELAKIEENLKSQSLTLESALSLQNMTKEDLISQLVIEKKLEKLLADRTAVTDEEVTQYINDNKDTFPENSDVESLKEQVRSYLSSQKFSTEAQSWLNDIKSSSTIKYFVKEFKIED